MIKQLRVKRIVFYTLFLSLALVQHRTGAQTIAGQLGLSKVNWEFDKKIILAELIQLDRKEAIAFWPVYEDYMKRWCKLMNERLAQLTTYCESVRNDAPVTQSHFTDELFASDKKLNKLQKKTYKKINKILTAEKAGKFKQLEYTFQLSLLSEMQQRAMLLGDISRKL